MFFYSAAVILFLAAAAKLYSATGTARILTGSDPLLHLNNRTLMTGLGLFEAGIALYLMLGRDHLLRAGVIFWLSSNFIMYRFWADLLAVKICPCLGTLTSNLPVSKARMDQLLGAIVLYWFLGSAFILWYEWLKLRDASETVLPPAQSAPLETFESRN